MSLIKCQGNSYKSYVNQLQYIEHDNKYIVGYLQPTLIDISSLCRVMRNTYNNVELVSEHVLNHKILKSFSQC